MKAYVGEPKMPVNSAFFWNNRNNIKMFSLAPWIKKQAYTQGKRRIFLAIDWLIAACCANSFQLSEINWAKSESHTYTLSFGAPSILLVNKISLTVRRDWQAAWHFYAIFASICMCHRNSHNSFRGRRVQLPHWCDTFRTPKGCGANGKDLSANIKHTGERGIFHCCEMECRRIWPHGGNYITSYQLPSPRWSLFLIRQALHKSAPCRPHANTHVGLQRPGRNEPERWIFSSQSQH